ARSTEVHVYLGLSDEEGFPHVGTIDFVDNQVDRATGTLRLRGLFRNADRLFSPGMFARIRVPIGDPHSSTLVSERALGSDQGQKFLYVVNDKDEVLYRRVQIGSLNNGLRVIEKGLEPKEKVILSGLQRVRQGMKVAWKMIAMTSEESPAAPPASGAVATTLDAVPRATAEPAPPAAVRTPKARPAALSVPNATPVGNAKAAAGRRPAS
ncbi:MAG: efflux RND transporter periplasmic adaptor subunit, partial [Thermoguttaceae bacterium]